jgi:hypothetical protein
LLLFREEEREQEEEEEMKNRDNKNWLRGQITMPAIFLATPCRSSHFNSKFFSVRNQFSTGLHCAASKTWTFS